MNNTQQTHDAQKTLANLRDHLARHDKPIAFFFGVVPVPGRMESSNTQVSADDSASSQQVAVPTRGWIWGVVGGGMGLGILALASAVILKVKRHRRVV